MKRGLRLLCAGLGFAAASAHAYIPPSSFQIATLAKKHRNLKSVRIKTRITGPAGQIREIGYFDAKTQVWKARFVDANDHEIYAFERKLGITDSLASLLIFENDPGAIMRALKTAGVPVVTEAEILALPGEPERRAAEKTSIGRLDKKVGWIIGEGNPSLWILKDEFVPLKLVAGGAEIRFEETKVVREFPYPRAISIYKGTDFVLKGEAMEVIMNPDLADMRAISVVGIPAISSTIPNAERALIEQWGAVDPVISRIVSVAVPRPLDAFFSYGVPDDERAYLPGTWVRVPFGRSTVVGFIVDDPKPLSALPSAVDPRKLKSVLESGDEEDRISPDVFALCAWASKYYAQPLGELLAAACPPASLGLRSAKREAKEIGRNSVAPREIHLNEEQRTACEGLNALRTRSPRIALLHGVTGSGKTEVYIELAKKVLAEGRGVLLLVPEIALTSQLHARLESGIGETVARWHSAMPDAKRRDQGAALRRGEIRVVVGARSAVFAPIRNLGLILVDEEHDPTYKQEDRVHYHARDLSIVRARNAEALVVLGSATPSLETRERVREGKYAVFPLTSRYALGGMPAIEVIDLGDEPMVEGIQAPLAEKTLGVIRDTLARGEQAMIYLNRRGFASFLRCRDCGEVSECPNCSISLTVHKRSRELRCHVCGHAEGIPDACVKCQSADLDPIGAGTESLEEELPKILPAATILRLDRDAVTSASRLEKTLNAFRNGEAQILLGTQMLAKGHDFPKVTLVVVVLADALFRYPDFRAPERALQILSQVAGRAGRAELPGRVLIQTYQPDAPVLDVLLGERTEASFLDEELELRRALDYPPFGRMARLRLESTERSEAVGRCEAIANALRGARTAIESDEPGVRLEFLGPSEAFLERAKGIFRWDVLIKSSSVRALSRSIANAKQRAAREKWTLLVDVDPYGLG